MPITVTNSLTRKKEPFVPMKEGEVRMYVCGPTVYNFIHVGNARPLIFFDVVRRYLELSGFKVTHVMNYTDVEDKIIKRSREENRTSLEVSEHYVREYEQDMASLGVLKPHLMPKVTDHIPQIITLIEGLIKKGVAYQAHDGEIFFAVRKFAGYGKLSGKNIDDLLVGARVDPNEKKNDPLDFSLWKPQKAADEPAWDSPWCKGRPGWHIECSAMAMEYLGETFDIHGGGMDLIHPHHENEIAQSEGCTQKPYVRYWLHNNMLTTSGEKMSKSLGNFFLTRDFVQNYGAETLKYLILSAHYRSTVDFSEKHIRETQATLHRLYSALSRAVRVSDITAVPGTPTTEEQAAATFAATFEAKWREAMDDDFNTAKVMGYVFEYVRAINAALDRKGFKPTLHSVETAIKFITELRKLSRVLNVFADKPDEFLVGLRLAVCRERGIDPATIEEAITKRREARARKDFATADSIRKELLEKGIELRDSTAGTDWDLSFST